MKMKAVLQLLVCAASALLATARAPGAADDLPIPSGWHVVKFTSAKGADASPASAVAASPEQPAPAADQTNQVVQFTSAKGADASPASAVAASPEQPAPPADQTNQADGLQIPAGYRIEGLTPAAESSVASSPPASSGTPPVAVDAAVAASASMPSDLTSTEETAQKKPTPSAEASEGQAAQVDGLQVPAGYRIEGLTPAAESSVASSPPASSGTPPAAVVAAVAAPASMPIGVTSTEQTAQKKPTPSEEASVGQATQVDGLDVPAGWKIQAVLNDDAAGPPTATAVAKGVPKPENKLDVAAASRQESKNSVAVAAEPVPAKSTQPSQPAASVSVPSAAVAPAISANSRTTVAREAQLYSAPGVLDEEGSLAVLEPLSVNQASAEQSGALYLPSETLSHITSVDCLTEMIDNGGQPCAKPVAQPTAMYREVEPSKAAQVEVEAPKPALRKPLLSKGSAHVERSVTQVARSHVEIAHSPAPTKVIAQPHRHHQESVTKVIEQEGEPHPSADAKVVQTVRHHKEVRAQPKVEGRSMADLVSMQD